MRVSVMLMLAAFPLVSCASLSEDQCRDGNWRAIGVSDGAVGRSANYISQHNKACGKIDVVPDVNAWLAGRTEGLRSYCTPANAYKVGRSGNTLSSVCTGPQLAALTQANITGRQYHNLTSQISDLRAQADDLRIQIRRISELADEDKLRERSRLRRELARTESRKKDLEFERIPYSELAQ